MTPDNLKTFETAIKAIIRQEQALNELAVCVLASGKTCRAILGEERFEELFDRYYREVKQGEEAKASDAHLQELRGAYRQLSELLGRE